jgi:hypothetical protein
LLAASLSWLVKLLIVDISLLFKLDLSNHHSFSNNFKKSHAHPLCVCSFSELDRLNSASLEQQDSAINTMQSLV